MNCNKSTKEINKLIAGVLGEPELYDVRENLRIVESGLPKEEAQRLQIQYNGWKSDSSGPYSEYTVTSSTPVNYSSELDHALYAAQRIAERNQCTYVLSLEDGVWKAAFGNWGDCSEFVGANPAFATCVSILKYLGKL